MLPLCLFCRVGRGPGIGCTDSERSWVFVLAWIWLRDFDACIALIHCLLHGGSRVAGRQAFERWDQVGYAFWCCIACVNSHVDRRVRQEVSTIGIDGVLLHFRALLSFASSSAVHPRYCALYSPVI